MYAAVRKTPLTVQAASFHTSTARHATPFLQLAALSQSREAQHFSKVSGLSIVQHSPALQLMKSSEVDPFERVKTAKATTPLGQAVKPIISHQDDAAAIAIGRTILKDHATQVAVLQNALKLAQEQNVKAEEVLRSRKEAWNTERRQLEDQSAHAGTVVLAAVVVATVCATWRFWPDKTAKVADAPIAVAETSMLEVPQPRLTATVVPPPSPPPSFTPVVNTQERVETSGLSSWFWASR